MNIIISLGYSKEEVLRMTIILPALYGLTDENIKQKIAFYDSIDLHTLAIENPLALMQSTSLSYARYKFYLSKGIEINNQNKSLLFMGNKKFEKKYEITKEELLKKYNYERDVLNKSDKDYK